MSPAFVDTDVIIRLLTGDNPSRQRAAQALFERVERGDLILHSPVTVIADAVYVLASKRLYGLPRSHVAALLVPLVSLPGLRIQGRQLVLRALHLYGETSGLDFGDAILAAMAEDEPGSFIFSYDTDFDRLRGITRREPD